MPVADHAARLKKQPFTVVLTFPQLDGVMVHASLKSDLLDAVKAGRSVSSVLPVPAQGLREGLHNPKRLICVNDRQYNYWYYLGKTKSSFDQVIAAPREFVCKRVIARFAADNDSPAAPLADLPHRDLYLTFVATAWSDGRRVETSAEYVKLTFD